MESIQRKSRILAFVGSAEKPPCSKKTAQFRSQGKTVLVTAPTHMFIEADTLLTDDPEPIIHDFQKTGYAMITLGILS